MISPGYNPWMVSWSCPSRDVIPWRADRCNFFPLHPSGLPGSSQLPSPPRGACGGSHQEKPELLQLGRKAAFSTLCPGKEASAAQGLQQLFEAALLLLSHCWKKAIPLLFPSGLVPAELCHTQSIYFAFTQGMAPTFHGQLAHTGHCPQAQQTWQDASRLEVPQAPVCSGKGAVFSLAYL